MPRRILLSAGDPSGDYQTANLARELLRREPDLQLYGPGGQLMAEAGVAVDGDLVSLSSIGAWDLLRSLFAGRRLLRDWLARVAADPPDAAVLVDCGIFNLPLGRALRAAGVPVLGYFPPGSWTGSAKRAAKVAEAYDAVATPFPKPIPHYQRIGLRHELVGHPLVDELAPLAATREAGALDGPPTLALLPGSRRQEIRWILPYFLAAAKRLRAERPELRVVLSRAATAPGPLFDAILRDSGVEVEVVDGAREALLQATAALVKSGTVALEALLLHVPQVVAYRVNPLAFLIASIYVWPRPKHISMTNILADQGTITPGERPPGMQWCGDTSARQGDRVVPELLQYSVNATVLAKAVRPYLSDTPERRAMLDKLRVTAGLIDGGGAVSRTADLLFELLDRPAQDSSD